MTGPVTRKRFSAHSAPDSERSASKAESRLGIVRADSSCGHGSPSTASPQPTKSWVVRRRAP
jgi:hypothetical protein